MTISRIFSSLYNLYPQTQPEVSTEIQAPIIQEDTPKEGKVHTWHLVNGDKVYLICNNGKLECHFVTSNGNITINEVDPPPSFTQQEAINFLLKLHPTLSESGSIKFIDNGEEIHTWHLKDGRKAHLIRNNDQFECQIVNDEESIISQIDLPDWLTPEEAINRLLEMYPILRENNSVKFIENQEELHTWEVKYGNPITLIRIGEEIGYRTVYEEDGVIKKISMQDGFLEEQIEWFKKRYPHVYPAKGENGEKTCFIEFKEKITEEKSAVDGKTLLDMNHWCVTLMNTNSSGSYPCGWMGHASLVIETIEEGGYFARSAHLIKTNGKADVKFNEIDRESLIKWTDKVSKNDTWTRPKEDIQRMMDQIYKDVCNQKEGNPNVSFKMDSGKLLDAFSELSMQHHSNKTLKLYDIWKRRKEREKLPLQEGFEEFYNCIEYSIRNLSVANISPYLRPGFILSKIFCPTPMLYAGSLKRAMAQEVSLIASYTALHSVPLYLLGGFIGGPLGALLLGGAGSAVALTDVASAHLREVYDHFTEAQRECIANGGQLSGLPIGFPYVRLEPQSFGRKNHKSKPREPERDIANGRPAIIRGLDAIFDQPPHLRQ